MRSPTLWLAGATAVTIAATATAAAAAPVWAQRPAAPAPGAVAVPAAETASLTAATPDQGRRRGNPGAQPAPTAKVSLTEADAGKAITVKPGTEIDVALKPDSGQRWSPPTSDNPNTVSRGGRMGWRGRGQPQANPDPGPGRGRGNGSTQAVFFAHRSGDATLSSAERQGGLLLLLRRGSGPSKSWSVKVTVSGPAPAAPAPQPKPQPKPGAPGAGAPGAPSLPGGLPAAPAAVTRLAGQVSTAAQRLQVTLPQL